MVGSNSPNSERQSPEPEGGGPDGATRITDEQFAALVKSHWGWVRSMVRRELPDASLADDAAQAVFLLAWQRLRRSGHADAGVRAWLRRSAGYVCSNLRRSEGRRAKSLQRFARLTSRRGYTDDGTEPPERIHSALAGLAVEDRSIITAHFFDGENLVAIARRLGISRRAAQLRLRRALDRLGQGLDREGPHRGWAWSATVSLLSSNRRPRQQTPAQGATAINRVQTGPTLKRHLTRYWEGVPTATAHLAFAATLAALMTAMPSMQPRPRENGALTRDTVGAGWRGRRADGNGPVTAAGQRHPPPGGRSWLGGKATRHGVDVLFAPNPVPQRERRVAWVTLRKRPPGSSDRLSGGRVCPKKY